MPAVISEAYMSPFHNFTRGTQSSSSNTADIRQSPPLTSGTQPATGHAFAMPSDYRISSVAPLDNDEEIRSIYNSLRTPQYDEPKHVHSAAPTQSAHDCNELIARIMACPSCRQKLRQILLHEESPPPQSGGAPTLQMSPSLSFLEQGMWPVVTNFLIGLAIIVLIDKIVKLRS